METLVNMTVRPDHLLIGDLIECDGRVARVKFIIELWDDRFKLILTCQCGHYNYIYGCASNQPITLLSI